MSVTPSEMTDARLAEEIRTVASIDHPDTDWLSALLAERDARDAAKDKTDLCITVRDFVAAINLDTRGMSDLRRFFSLRPECHGLDVATVVSARYDAVKTRGLRMRDALRAVRSKLALHRGADLSECECIACQCDDLCAEALALSSDVDLAERAARERVFKAAMNVGLAGEPGPWSELYAARAAYRALPAQEVR